jgi:uncharacterized membrane protein YGL010W
MESSTTELAFYESYHKHPINKLIHFCCIPLIVFSTNELFKEFYIAHENFNYPGLKKKYRFYITWMIHHIYCIYYFKTYGVYPGLLMMGYFTCIRYLSVKLNIKKTTALKLFSLSWFLQFVGHFIEGNRPALLDGLSQTFLEAPLFSFQYILPNLLKT